MVLSNIRGGELQLRLVSSSGLCETLKSFATATEAVELGQQCSENKPTLPVEGYVLMKGEDGELAVLTLSPEDSDAFVDFEITSSKLKRTEPNTLEQTIDFLLYFHSKIQFRQMTVVYRQPERGVPTAAVQSNRLWTKELSQAAVAGATRAYKKIGKVVASKVISSKGLSDELTYNSRCVAFKSLLLVLDEKSKWEVCLFEMDLDPTQAADSKLNFSWSQPIPW